MKQTTIMSFLLTLFALSAMADSKETVTVNGSVVNKFATSITFDGDNVTLTYDDGTSQTTDMETTSIAFNYVAVFSDAAGFSNVETVKTFGERTLAVEVNRSVKTGQWNTICLPFDMSADDIAAVFGDGTKVAQLESASESNINFASTTKMVAGRPYIIYPSHDLSSFTLEAALVKNFAEGSTASAETFDFIGTIDAVVPTGNVYYLANGNKVKRLSSGSTIKALHAYLLFTADGSTNVSTFSIDGVGTGIASTLLDETAGDMPIYTISGVYVGNDISRLPQGIYIVNGKKLIVNR